MKRNKKNIIIISSAPSSATGGALIHLKTLELLSSFVRETYFFGFEKPFNNISSIKTSSTDIVSDASSYIKNSLKLFSIANDLFEYSKNLYKKDTQIYIYISYLYPFCLIAILAKEMLHSEGIHVKLIVQPTGSDIWQIGYQLPSMTRYLAQQADKILSYSNRFKHQLSEFVNTDKISVVPPEIDCHIFKRVSKKRQNQLRIEYDLDEQEMVFIHLSNMRYIKGVNATFDLILYIAKRLRKKICLLLIGPETNDLKIAFNKFTTKKKANESYVEFSKANLTVRYYGIRSNVASFFQLADYNLNTSYIDSFNTSIAEGMACGVIPITSDCIGLLDFFKKNEFPGHLFSYKPICQELIIKREAFLISNAEKVKVVAFLNTMLNDKRKFQFLSKLCTDSILKYFSRASLLQIYKKAFDI